MRSVPVGQSRALQEGMGGRNVGGFKLLWGFIRKKVVKIDLESRTSPHLYTLVHIKTRPMPICTSTCSPSFPRGPRPCHRESHRDTVIMLDLIMS